jgi:hypothetical protein
MLSESYAEVFRETLLDKELICVEQLCIAELFSKESYADEQLMMKTLILTLSE